MIYSGYSGWPCSITIKCKGFKRNFLPVVSSQFFAAAQQAGYNLTHLALSCRFCASSTYPIDILTYLGVCARGREYDGIMYNDLWCLKSPRSNSVFHGFPWYLRVHHVPTGKNSNLPICFLAPRDMLVHELPTSGIWVSQHSDDLLHLLVLVHPRKKSTSPKQIWMLESILQTQGSPHQFRYMSLYVIIYVINYYCCCFPFV